MADQLYGRIATLTIAVPVATAGDYQHTTRDVIQIDAASDGAEPGLRVAFKITKSREKQPNHAEINVYNLSPNHRSALQQKGVRVQLEAGYRATGKALLFLGDLRTADHFREGADWRSTLKCGDGERGYLYARAARSFAPGTQAADVVRYLGAQMGLAEGNIKREASKIATRFDQGWVAFGPASSALDRLLNSIGWSWSIQDGALQLLASGDVLTGTAIPEVSPTSGLIGSPEMGSPEKKGGEALVKFKCLLTPSRPGARIRLRSERYDGEVAVKKCVYSGDTMGGEWYSEIEGVLLRG